MIDPRTDAAGEEYLAYNQRRWGSDSWTGSLRRFFLIDSRCLQKFQYLVFP